MKVEIYEYTTNPLNTMGLSASKCWNSNPSNASNIAKDCFETNHGRVSEFADINFEISECSARLMREVYTHVQASRLQESTRYVNMIEFKYITPPTINNKQEAKYIYDNAMKHLKYAMQQLQELGIPKEDYANLLPLGSHSKMVLKINVRSLINMAHQRTCTRAYWEYRDLMKCIIKEIRNLNNDEWDYIADLLVPKCEFYGYCTENKETRNCNRKPHKSDVIK